MKMTFQTGGPSAHLKITYANANVLCAGSAGRAEKVATYLDTVDTIIQGTPGDDGRKHVTVHGTYQGVPITAFSTGMGPASVAITMPEVIEAYEGRDMTFLRIGTSGGLHPKTNVGDFVISTTIDRRETTSEWIMGKDYVAKASPEAVTALWEIASQTKGGSQQVHVGPSMVVNELYWSNRWLKNQYRGNEERRQAEIPDVLAVSMEFSVLCALRDAYNEDGEKRIATGNLLSISDLPLSTADRVDQSGYAQLMQEVEERQIKIGLDTLVRLSKER
jgi:uridine phosphorylase